MRGPIRRWRDRRVERICRETRTRIQEIVDGEIPGRHEKARLERHIDECRPCGVEADTIRELKDALARVGREPDPAVRQRLTSVLEQIRAGQVAADAGDGDDRDNGRI